MADLNNTDIVVIRQIDGFTIRVHATYIPSVDGWECRVKEGHLSSPWIDTRGPDETGNDVWATIIDMIDLALSTAQSRERFNAGPYSSAQCR